MEDDLFGGNEGEGGSDQDAIRAFAASLQAEVTGASPATANAAPSAPPAAAAPAPATAAPAYAPQQGINFGHAGHHAAASPAHGHPSHHLQPGAHPAGTAGVARPVAGSHAIGSGLTLGATAPSTGAAPGAYSTPSAVVKTEPPSTPTSGAVPGTPTTPAGSAPGTPGAVPQKQAAQAIVQHYYHRFRKGELTTEQLRATFTARFNAKVADDLMSRIVKTSPVPPGQVPGVPKPGMPGQPTTPGASPGMIPRPGATPGMAPQGGIPGQMQPRPGQAPTTPTNPALAHMHLKLPGAGQAGDGVSVTALRQGGNIFGNPQLANYIKTQGSAVGMTPTTATAASTPQPPAKRPRTVPPPSGQPTTPLPSTGPTAGTATPGGAAGVPKKPALGKKGDQLDDKQANFQVKDLTDVTRLAGVNLKEESNLFLPTYSTGVGEERQHPPEEVQSPFINRAALQKRVTEIAAKYGLKPSEELYEYLALAAQHRLTDVVEKLATISKQRLDIYKDEMQIEVTSDPRKQLKLIEKREKEEKERRDAEEKERALKEKKPEADKKKSDQARLEEEEKIRTRTANLTALQAIGDVRPRRTTPGSGTVVTAGGPAAGRGAGAPAGTPGRPAMPIFTKQMLDQLTALQKLQKTQQLTPQQTQQLANLQAQLTRFRNVAMQLNAARKMAGMASEGPRTRFDTRVITMKDLEFYLLHKDAHTKYSKIVWRLEKKKRSASLAAAGQSASLSSSSSSSSSSA